MKRILSPTRKSGDFKSGKLLTVYRVEVALVLALALLLIIGSLFALFRSKESKPILSFGETATTRHSRGNNASGNYADDTGVSVFSGLGRQRISIPAANSSEAPSTLIISVAFPYPSDDQIFQEELASNIRNFKDITVDYFSSLTTGELTNTSEDTIKAELLKRYNAKLRLGKINALYFNEMMIAE